METKKAVEIINEINAVNVINDYVKKLYPNLEMPMQIHPEVRMYFNEEMKSAYMFVPGVMALILKWAFSNNKSVVERAKKIGNEDEYGLLKVAASPKNHIEGEMLRQKLLSVGIKASLSQTKTGPKILVFEKDLKIAKATLNS